MYILYVIIYSIICGVVCNKILENKGYNDNWFWWGFWFGIFALIVAATKPDNHGNYQSSVGYGTDNSMLTRAAQGRRDAEFMKNDGWVCTHCHTKNASYVGTCSCGRAKPQSVILHKPVEIEKSWENNETQKSVGQVRAFNTVTNESDNLDILKKYKELLDMGAISEEEFLEKKKELLSFNTGEQSVHTGMKQVENEENTNSWVCSNCGDRNTPDRKSCKHCGAVKITAIYQAAKTPTRSTALCDWRCPQCNTINKCYMGRCQCGTSKSDGIIIE